MFFKDKRILKIQSTDDMLAILKSGNSMSDFRKGCVIHVWNKMNRDYSYTLSEEPGALEDSFRPDLTPDEVLAMGAFEGKYLNDCLLEFPKEWFLRAIALKTVSPGGTDISLNYFKVHSRLPLNIWKEYGWVPGGDIAKLYPVLSDHSKNPDERGWFQWYCRYYLGRRMELDKKQIARWKSFKARHLGQLRYHLAKNHNVQKQRQALLQWGIDPEI